MNDLVIEGYTEEEIEAVLASDDPELIDRMMSGEKVTLDQDKPVEEEQTAEVKTVETSENKQDENGAASGAKDVDTNGEAEKTRDEEMYVESKSGGNKIPYVVLDNTRKERDQLRAQLNDAQQRLSTLESTSTKMQKHLENAGIDLSALEQGERLTDQQLAELEEIDPAVAKLARITMGLFERIESVQTHIDTTVNQSTNTDPVVSAIESNKDLSAWSKGDPDRWETAVFYDEQLKSAPAFKNKSLEERFAEAVRLTKSAFGDPVEETKPRENAVEIAAQKVAAAQSASVPRTLTDLGKSPQNERSLGDILADLDPGALADKMADMSAEQIEKMLAEMG